MLETVEVHNANPSDPLILKISGATPDDLLTVKSISGLTSPKVNLFAGDYSSEGSYYQGRRVERMNPVLTLKMNPDYKNDVEVSDIRELLYRAFYVPYPGSDGVKVLLKDDRRPDRYFIGYVDNMEIDHFAATREVQISMQSMEGYLLSENAKSAIGIFGRNWNLQYDGSVPTGFELRLEITQPTNQVTIKLRDELMVLQRNFTLGTFITINTKRGERSVKVNGNDYMAALYWDSKWLKLQPDSNLVTVYGTFQGDDKVAITGFNYREAWWGV